MHSLAQLNDYSNLAIEHGDERPYQIIQFDNSGNNSVITYPGVSYVHPTSFSNLNIISSPSTTTYSLYFPNYATSSPQVTWASTPNVTTSYLTGTYTAANVAGNVRYENIKSPTITFNNYSYTGNTSCVTTHNDHQGNSYSYTTSIWVKPTLTMTSSYNYSEDIIVSLPFTIGSEDTHSSTTVYYLEFNQITPTGTTSSELGRFIVNGTPGSYNGNVSISGTKNIINAIAISYDPPFDYTGTIIIDIHVTKKINNVISYAFIKTLTLTNTITNTEYTRPTSLSGTISTSIALSAFQITDMPDTGAYSLPDRTYILSLTRYGNITGTFSNGSNETISFTGTKSDINSALSTATFTTSWTPAAGSINFNLTRTTDSKILASNIATTTTAIEPIAGQYWQAGYFATKYNPSTGSTTSGVTHYLIYWPELNLYGMTELILDNYVPGSITSQTDGLTATSAWAGYAGSAIWQANTYSNDSATDWYMPAVTELQAIFAAIPQRFPSSDNYWTSTWDLHSSVLNEYGLQMNRNMTAPYNPYTQLSYITGAQVTTDMPRFKSGKDQPQLVEYQ
jgi:hypothetical protein